MHSSKVCFKCGKRKPIENFYRHPMMADGRLNKCKDCTKADVQGNRLRRIEHYRAYDVQRAKLPERKRQAAAISKAWLQADKRRTAAHNAITRAIRAGKVVRQPCERCGRNDSHAHHDDYDRKLDVMWLCPACHRQRHKELKLLR